MALSVPPSRFTSSVGGGSAFYVRPLDHITKPEHHNIMKFSNGKKFRLGAPKYSPLTTNLYGAGGVFGILSWVVAGTAKDWFAGISMLALIAGLVVSLAGMIAERKEWEAAHKTDDSK